MMPLPMPPPTPSHVPGPESALKFYSYETLKARLSHDGRAPAPRLAPPDPCTRAHVVRTRPKNHCGIVRHAGAATADNVMGPRVQGTFEMHSQDDSLVPSLVHLFYFCSPR